MWESIAVTSGTAMSFHPYRGRSSPGIRANGGRPGGCGPNIRDRYGSMRMTVVPSLILHPAVPRYSSDTGAFFSALGGFCAAATENAVAARRRDASAVFSIEKISEASALAKV